MELTTERHEHVLSVNVAGRIDGSNAAMFSESLRAAIEQTDRALLLVFRDLRYIDHAGLNVVSVAAKSLGDRNVRLALCELSEPVLALFRISGLDRLLPIYASEADARVSFEGESVPQRRVRPFVSARAGRLSGGGAPRSCRPRTRARADRQTLVLRSPG